MSTVLFLIGLFVVITYLIVASAQAIVAVAMYNESGNTPKQKAEYRLEFIRALIWPIDALHKIQNTLHGR